MKTRSIVFAVLLILGVTACQNEEVNSYEELQASSPMDAYVGDSGLKSSVPQLSITSDLLDEINEGLALEGKNYRAVMAEFITAGGSGEVGQTVLSKHVGNKQLAFDFVPNDVRRSWSGPSPNEITYAIDQTIDAIPPFGNLTAAQSDAAIVRATDTWDNLTCSDLTLTRNPDNGLDIGYVAFLYGFGGSPFIIADIQHAGFRDLAFQPGVLGVTFTFGFTDVDGFTDIDNNGKFDAAFREIYYDPFWLWNDDGVTNIDLESVAVHELGHGLSQAHFGKVFIKKNGDLQVAPRAIMNALYTGPFRDLQGTDTGGHCSIWANWPHN
jgi:hypothetical protein